MGVLRILADHITGRRRTLRNVRISEMTEQQLREMLKVMQPTHPFYSTATRELQKFSLQSPRP